MSVLLNERRCEVSFLPRFGLPEGDPGNDLLLTLAVSSLFEYLFGAPQAFCRFLVKMGEDGRFSDVSEPADAVLILLRMRLGFGESFWSTSGEPTVKKSAGPMYPLSVLDLIRSRRFS